jgi:hypothetical protein
MALLLESMLDFGAPMLWSEELGQTALEDCSFGVLWILMFKDSILEWMMPLEDFNWGYAAEHSGDEVGAQTQVFVLPKARNIHIPPQRT